MKQNGAHQQGRKYLVVVADDFGRTSSVTCAVAEAHDRGILKAASLMAGGDAFSEAVRVAHTRKGLSVGLHVTLCDGRAVLPPSRIPGLADRDGFFEKNPSLAWVHYMKPGLLSQIVEEVDAQFSSLERAGIRPTHVDGHHHIHMHPLIFEVVCRMAWQRGVRWIRLTKESLSMVIRFRSEERGALPFAEWAVLGVLGLYNRRIARKYGMRSPYYLYGLSGMGGIDEEYLLRMLKHMRSPLSELFTHPDEGTVQGRKEREALTSIRVRTLMESRGITPVGYGGLYGEDTSPSCEERW
ncbi:MAG: ChbG/HpnK family deacetylase [Alphaproteobacteria bacterium]|uniref:ChbG/HpnK family deacetylase n=1 Tax=Candidatus Nitrobium versatile TaxID=2884831 RepID=A0A953SHJ5_9BACT|nr:ChbG/HpnK family deacetylase [Candidatus Nitrobium versatile]